MRTFLFLPPVHQPTGGVAVVAQLARILRASGREAWLVLRQGGSWLPEGVTDAAPMLAWEDLALTPGDCWLVPEGWVNALAPGLNARCRCVSYVQNWAYLFSALPEGVGWRSLPVEFLAVSQPVAQFIEQATGRAAPVLRPAVDPGRFAGAGEKPGGPVRVAYMPRKNKALAAQIRAVFESRNAGADVEFTPIEGQDAAGVARLLGGAHIFLATGFPEGCPLPPLEAMAAGCLGVGFTGFGGWDYMRQAQGAPRFTPWWPLRAVPWGGNGFWCADADVLDAALCLEEAVALVRAGGPRLAAVLESARATAAAYDPAAQARAVDEIWSVWEARGAVAS
ncbi:MAG: glycosyltransferase family 1 protein [Desulfovibrionaceae bacterium]